MKKEYTEQELRIALAYGLGLACGKFDNHMEADEIKIHCGKIVRVIADVRKDNPNDMYVRQSALSVRIKNVIRAVTVEDEYKIANGEKPFFPQPYDALMLSDIAEVNYHQWLRMRHCGKKTTDNLKAYLTELGFTMP